jgi:hypothetical protein
MDHSTRPYRIGDDGAGAIYVLFLLILDAVEDMSQTFNVICEVHLYFAGSARLQPGVRSMDISWLRRSLMFMVTNRKE